MRLLMIHADRFSFAVTEQVAGVGVTELAPDERSGRIDEALVLMVSVEKQDELGSADVVEQAATQARQNAEKVGTSRIMVYPYAHLSNALASPRAAADVVTSLFEALRAIPALEVHRAPFGYYKEFELSCKGHPLSERAMTISPRTDDDSLPKGRGGPESQAIAAERILRSEWRVYQPDGSFVVADEFDFSTHTGLKNLFTYEREGSRVAEEAPPHIRLMREHELVDYEPASDSGNMRWYPKGLVVKRLLEGHISNLMLNYGAMEVETPIMYDYAHPALAKYLDRFPARQYVVKSEDKEFFLRFAACFGQYMIQHDMVTSYRDLPVRLYELTHFSFRREQGGELAGLRRLRTFTMPDMHSLVRDVVMAKDEFLKQVELCQQWLDDLDLQCVPAIRFVRSFLDEHPDFVKALMGVLGRPALVEVWDERFFYFVAKFEMNFIDTAGKAACLSTVQIDVENTERFNINYVAEDGTKSHPLLMHTSVSGSLDRNLYALLESQAILMAHGKKASWPVWLAPTQVRLLPVTQAQVEGALELAEQIPYRVDVDDRDEKLGKKVRDAEKDWVPYTLVIGEKELGSGILTVRERLGQQADMTVEELLERIAVEVAGKPYRRANLPRRLSVRPVFVG